MRGTSAARTVIRLQPLEWATSKNTSSTLQEGSLVFSMDDMESRREAEHVDATAREAVARVEVLLRIEDDVQASVRCPGTRGRPSWPPSPAGLPGGAPGDGP